jgi:hypothetical protein
MYVSEVLNCTENTTVYLNSLLATLNARATLRGQSEGGGFTTVPLSGAPQFGDSIITMTLVSDRDACRPRPSEEFNMAVAFYVANHHRQTR